MNPSDAIEAIEKPLSSLPYSLSRHILEHLRKLTSHEPVPGIMGKSGAGKSSLCNALFPVVKCRIFPVCWPCLLNAVRTVLARMSG